MLFDGDSIDYLSIKMFFLKKKGFLVEFYQYTFLLSSIFFFFFFIFLLRKKKMKEAELEKKMKEAVQRKKSEVLVAKIQQDHFLVLRVAVLVSRHLRGDPNPLQFFCKGKNLETAELVHEFLRQKNNLPNTLSREKKMKEASRRVLIKKGLI